MTKMGLTILGLALEFLKELSKILGRGFFSAFFITFAKNFILCVTKTKV